MHDELLEPPPEFSLMPFWFWNDVLDEQELLRQIADFSSHGVQGFVIHPRVGLPRDCGWMSSKLLGFMKVAIDEAARRGIKVILYDEGMYPSGSSSGQVVARSPELACRCLALLSPSEPLPVRANTIHEIPHDGRPTLVIDRPANSCIRGLHYIGEGPAEDEPPAGDILNPATAKTVIELVYDVFARHFGHHFGSTILGIFTDEPNPLGRCRERSVMPGTTGILEHVSRLLGYDFRPHLHQLWSEAEDAKPWKEAWHRAIRLRLNETWYAPLSQWCADHGVALCGHPDKGDEIGVQRFFHFPGQDLVWRWVEPGRPSGTNCAEATQGKCTSSAMIHLGRRRNSNEFAGAYGAQTTFDEVRALAHWCLVRGVNLLIAHAFYYSVRGPRRDERPPQIGPHTPEWSTDTFYRFAHASRRLCWINTDSRHLCHVAILTQADRCPWPAAATLLAHQRDFNYLDPQILLNRATVDAGGIHIAEMRYTLLILDGADAIAPAVQARLEPLIRARRVIRWSAPADAGIPSTSDPDTLIRHVDAQGSLPILVRTNSRAVRLRVVEKGGAIFGLLFNEGDALAELHLEFPQHHHAEFLDPEGLALVASPAVKSLSLKPMELRLLRVRST